MLPFPTNTTAWKPFGLPMILVVPHVRGSDGRRIAGSEILYTNGCGVRIYIADVTSIAPVAGPDHRGIFNPDVELYSRIITETELSGRLIDPSYVTDNVETKDGSEIFQITSRAGVIADIPYLAHADYYDISDILLDIEQLPHNHYTLVYEACYHQRKVSDTGYLVCFDTSQVIFTRHRFRIHHPGEVLLQLVENTPGLYLDNSKRSQDSTVAFYRPFAEILQDIHSEQDFIEKSNWVYDIRPEHIPYLGYLLGWDLPYFPKSIDSLRRALLRNTVRLQRLKGTKRAVRELFDLFGFAVSVENVWWTPDGSAYVGVGERQDFPITKTPTYAYEPVLLNYATSGYGQIVCPLLHRPIEKNIVVESFLVTKDSTAHETLEDAEVEFESNADAFSSIANSEYDTPFPLQPTDDGVVGYSRVVIDDTGKGLTDIEIGWPAHNGESANFNYGDNTLQLGFNRYVEFDDIVLYTFVSYKYNKISVPEAMDRLQSNRFDIEILSKDGQDAVRPDIIVFLVEFIFRVKAFHSLLRKILYTVTLNDVYQVTDYCVGGEITQDPTKDAGMQQVPPQTIIPNVPDDRCLQLDPEDMGYRPQDLRYRNKVLTGLEEEAQAWADLGTDCEFSLKGQARITDEPIQEDGTSNGVMISSDATRTVLCVPDGRDFCYKGRVDDVLAVHGKLLSCDTWRFKMCNLNMGHGVYYTLPTSLTVYVNERKTGGLLGKLHSQFKSGPQALHYSEAEGFGATIDPNRMLAFRRPPLDIQKDNLGFPGHRMITMDKMVSTFTHDSYNLRPWDIPIDCTCDPMFKNELNAVITEDSTGEQFLTYDTVPYVVAGNGKHPDVESFGAHDVLTGFDSDDVTHAIYVSQAVGHPAVALDPCCHDTGSTEDQAGIVSVDSPIFSSSAECDSITHDYEDGYPSSGGYLNEKYTAEFDYFPSVDGTSNDLDLKEALGIPERETTLLTVLFTMSSQIRVSTDDTDYDRYRGYRFDCGCLSISCDSTEQTPVVDCTISQFLSEYGDLNPDQLNIEQIIALKESVGASTYQFNDPRTSMFAVKQKAEGATYVLSATGFTGPDPYPPHGSFSYKDDYDTIYEIQWESIPDKTRPVTFLDFVTVIKEPRRWGVSNKKGRISQRQLYYDATISVIRQVFAKSSEGIALIAEGAEQSLDEFQASFLCGRPFTDPFINKCDTPIVDHVSGIVNVGPAWADEFATVGSEWVDPDTTGTDANDLIWIDVFA